MNKTQVKAWFLDLGYQCSYSGKSRTMYIKGMSQRQIDYYNLVTDFSVLSDL